MSENPAGGGCIANARIIRTVSGKEYFLKSYTSGGSTIFLNEANGLRELAKAQAVRVPEVIHTGDKFLLLEKITQGGRKKDFFAEFGTRLARLHMYRGEKFGFFENNFIGSNPQINLPQSKSWADFYFNNRLMYQFRLAESKGYADSEFRASFRKLESRVYSILDESNGDPSLLHGDLWGGNYMKDENGNPVLIDPAVYYGHREADLAMTFLFGGFSPEFYNAYNETYPLSEGWQQRLGIYKLYHLMNHLNIFGSGYYRQTVEMIKEYI